MAAKSQLDEFCVYQQQRNKQCTRLVFKTMRMRTEGNYCLKQNINISRLTHCWLIIKLLYSVKVIIWKISTSGLYTASFLRNEALQILLCSINTLELKGCKISNISYHFHLETRGV